MRVLCGLLGLLLTSGVLSANVGEASYQDFEQTLRARRLLLTEEALAGLNLGVRVRDRVAVLWGPVPSKELGERAAHKLQTMVELREVRNELVVEVEETLPLLLPAPPPVREEPAPPPFLPVPAPPRVEVAQAPAPPPPPRPMQRGRQAPGKVASMEEEILELPAVPVGGQAPPASASEPTLAEKAQKLRLSQERFVPVRIQVEGARVILQAAPHQMAALHELAQIIARWPGVDQVIVR